MALVGAAETVASTVVGVRWAVVLVVVAAGATCWFSAWALDATVPHMSASDKRPLEFGFLVLGVVCFAFAGLLWARTRPSRRA
jgi:hypothetical protein